MVSEVHTQIQTEIKPSTIPGAGKGRFFKQDHLAGEIVRVQSIDDDLFVFSCVDDFKNTDIELICNFSHTRCLDSDIECDDVYINKKPLYTNHSINHNICFKFVGDKKITFISRNVVAGEEMFQNYTHYRKVDWFEDYLRSINKQSLREFAATL